MRSTHWHFRLLVLVPVLVAAASMQAVTDTLVGDFTINYRYNAAGCPPGDGNPYYCPDPLGSGPFFINNPTSGEYQLVTISANDGGGNADLWVGTASGGTRWNISIAPGATINFDVAAGQNIVLYAWDWYDYDNPADAWTEVELDQVTNSGTPTPEPASLVLLGSGLLALACICFRRRALA